MGVYKAVLQLGVPHCLVEMQIFVLSFGMLSCHCDEFVFEHRVFPHEMVLSKRATGVGG